jgi:hypothetical protein
VFFFLSLFSSFFGRCCSLLSFLSSKMGGQHGWSWGLRLYRGRASTTSSRENWLAPEQLSKPVTWRWVRAPVHDGKGGRLEVYGTDEQRVRQTFSDRKAQLLTEDAFRMRREAKG